MARKPLSKPIRYRLEALLAYIGYSLFRILPIDIASWMGGRLAALLGPLSGAHRTASLNLAQSIPDLSARQRRTILLDVWDNLGRVVAEYAVLSRLWRDEQNSRIEICGQDHIAALIDSKTPAIIFTGHIANWEITALTVAQTTQLPALVYRAPNNPLVARLIRNVRGEAAATLVPKGAGGVRTLMQTLRDGGFVMMAVDQKMNTGLPIPFFGREAMTGDAIARLAQRYRCPIIPMVTERTDGCHFRVTFEEPWHLDSAADSDADVQATLKRINTTLERWIRAHPGQWLWPHNRWPKDEASE